jgi:hypothetical protein
VQTFPVAIYGGPPAPLTAPDGRPALQVFAEGGVNAVVSGSDEPWTAEVFAQEKWYHQQAQQYGVWLLPRLGNMLVDDGNDTTQSLLEQAVQEFGGSAALAGWLGVDEPWWGHVNVSALRSRTALVRSLDPQHPISIIQAPRGVAADLTPYLEVCDLQGIDI